MSKTKAVSETLRKLKSWERLLSRLLSKLKDGSMTVSKQTLGDNTLYCLQSHGRDIICVTPGYKLCDGYTSKVDTFRINRGPDRTTSIPMDRVGANSILSLYALMSGEENVFFWPITDKHVRSIKIPSKEEWCQATEAQIEMLRHQIKMQEKNNFIAITFFQEQAKRVGVHVHIERTNIEAAREKTLTLLHKKADRLHYELPLLARVLISIDDGFHQEDGLMEDENEWLWGYINQHFGGKSFVARYFSITNKNKEHNRHSRTSRPYTQGSVIAFFLHVLEFTRGMDPVEVKVALRAVMDLMEVRQRIRKVSGKNPGRNNEALDIAIQQFRQKGV